MFLRTNQGRTIAKIIQISQKEVKMKSGRKVVKAESKDLDGNMTVLR